MTETVPDISPLMPMHQDPLLVYWSYPNFGTTVLQISPHLVLTENLKIFSSRFTGDVHHCGPDDVIQNGRLIRAKYHGTLSVDATYFAEIGQIYYTITRDTTTSTVFAMDCKAISFYMVISFTALLAFPGGYTSHKHINLHCTHTVPTFYSISH